MQISKEFLVNQYSTYVCLHEAFFTVSKPAPSFNGTAVIDGAFKQIKLLDFKGILKCLTNIHTHTHDIYICTLKLIYVLVFLPIGKYLVLVFYPLDL